MNSKLLFLLGCIPTRLFIAFLSYYSLNIDSKYSNILKYILTIVTFLIGLSFIIIYKKGWRKTGLETGGKEIWWNNYRPIHGSIYLIFSVLSMIYIINPSYSSLKHIWIILLLDVFIGIFAFSKNYNYI
jgi:hypothetical protein